MAQALRGGDEGGAAVSKHELDVDLLMQMLDHEREERGISWREVAREIDVPASTFTRMALDRKPSVDAFLSMCEWCGAYAEELIVGNTVLTPPLRNSGRADAGTAGRGAGEG